MNAAHPVQGLWCAMLTPLDASGGVDHGLLVAHARSLLAKGVDGVALAEQGGTDLSGQR